MRTDPKAQAAANAERDEATRSTSRYVVDMGGMPDDDEYTPL